MHRADLGDLRFVLKVFDDGGEFHDCTPTGVGTGDAAGAEADRVNRAYTKM